MPLNVNGYNAQFSEFVNFANNEIATLGKKGQTSIAQLGGETALGDRNITANTNDTVSKWGSRS